MITEETYFSSENNWAFMSASQFKTFLDCEERAMAELRGEYQRESTTALLVGSYVDANFSKTLDIFRAKHPELFTKAGDLKADYRNAEEIITRIQRDPLFMMMVSGEQQVIKTGEIAGVPFKIKIDSYLPADKCKEIAEGYHSFSRLLFEPGAIVDLKIMRDFNSVYRPDLGRVPFIEAWGYDIQAAIYQAVEGRHLPFYIAAATKEKDAPNIEIFEIPQDVIDAALTRIEDLAPRYQAIKLGEIQPERCGYCTYCKQTKILSEAIDYRFYNETEEEE